MWNGLPHESDNLTNVGDVPSAQVQKSLLRDCSPQEAALHDANFPEMLLTAHDR